MVLKWLNNRGAALVAAAGCSAFASVHSGRYTREVSSLRADLAACRAENDQLRADVVSALQFMRGYSPAPADEGGGSDGGGTAPAAPAEIVGGRSMIAQGRPGFSLGGNWWVVGMQTPWGVLEQAYPGGCTISGRRYCFREGGFNEL